MGKFAYLEMLSKPQNDSTVSRADLEIRRQSNMAAPLAKKVDGKGSQTRSSGSSTSWLDIPPEIKIKIFTYLEPKYIV
jgi:hypothetical protein